MTQTRISDAATQTATLPRRGLVLLGTFVKPDGPRALLRTARGRIEQVAPGDQVGGVTIAAIEPGLVHFQRRGEPGRLRIAGD